MIGLIVLFLVVYLVRYDRVVIVFIGGYIEGGARLRKRDRFLFVLRRIFVIKIWWCCVWVQCVIRVVIGGGSQGRIVVVFLSFCIFLFMFVIVKDYI